MKYENLLSVEAGKNQETSQYIEKAFIYLFSLAYQSSVKVQNNARRMTKNFIDTVCYAHSFLYRETFAIARYYSIISYPSYQLSFLRI